MLLLAVLLALVNLGSVERVDRSSASEDLKPGGLISCSKPQILAMLR